jgi:hypothetical protein
MTSSLGGFGGIQGPRGGGQGDIIPKGYRKGQLQQFSPEQMQLFSQLFSHVSPDSYLSRLAGGDEDIFNQIEAPAHRQFQGKLGNIASRFSGMGLGGRHSSGFQNTTSAAASNFSQDLASNRQQLQRQALMDLMGISQSLLNQRPFENLITPKAQKKPSFLQQLATDFASSFAGSAGKQLGSGKALGGDSAIPI